jgi:hypothetical protein
MFRFECEICGEWHDGVPVLNAPAPLYYYSIPAEERSVRCELTASTCIVDNRHFFVKGYIELAIKGGSEIFKLGVWVSLKQQDFDKFIEQLSCDNRSTHGPYFGWLSAYLKTYPDSENLKTRVHLLDNSLEPYIELEPTCHPLAVQQRDGISVQRLAQLLSAYSH